jgi:chorismate mutase
VIELSELRLRLDQMTDRILSRLKDRSRFPLNGPAYRSDALPIRGRAGISFLEFALEGLEAYHASLGRYAYPDQHPVFSPRRPDSPVARVVGKPSLPEVQISIKDDLLAFYQQLLPRLCAPGDDPDSYGETVYIDADLLQLLNERINVGRYVAQAKIDSDPTIAAVVHDTAALVDRLKIPSREEALIDAARRAAQRYELDAGLAEHVFRWIIAETLLVEIAYLQQCLAPGQPR